MGKNGQGGETNVKTRKWKGKGAERGEEEKEEGKQRRGGGGGERRGRWSGDCVGSDVVQQHTWRFSSST